MTFHGYVDDARERMTACDLFLHLCPVEPFGLAILEAMAAGLPVIVPDQGGAATLVDDGKDGLKHRAGDVESLKRVLLQAASDGSMLDAMVRAGSRDARESVLERVGARRYRAALESVAR